MNITNRSEAREREIRIQRYVETLELVIQKNYRYLKSIMEDFQEKCRLATSTTGAPPGLFTEIPDIYLALAHFWHIGDISFSVTPENEISPICQK